MLAKRRKEIPIGHGSASLNRLIFIIVAPNFLTFYDGGSRKKSCAPGILPKRQLYRAQEILSTLRENDYFVFSYCCIAATRNAPFSKSRLTIRLEHDRQPPRSFPCPFRFSFIEGYPPLSLRKFSADST